MGGVKVRKMGSRDEAPGKIYKSDYLNEKLWPDDVTPTGVEFCPSCNDQGCYHLCNTVGGN